MRVAIFGLAIGAVLAMCSCAGDETEWDRSWRDAEGRDVHERVVSTVQGAEHCDWESAVFLYLGWPLGTRSKSADDARLYLRDPEGILSTETVGPFEEDAQRPSGATATGYHLDDLELWLADDAAAAVYLIHGSKVERWPRAKTAIACA